MDDSRETPTAYEIERQSWEAYARLWPSLRTLGHDLGAAVIAAHKVLADEWTDD